MPAISALMIPTQASTALIELSDAGENDMAASCPPSHHPRDWEKMIQMDQ
jgi:hypothetical protein